ncbi:MAG TPA: ADOP family duplicated permease [Gemmatimonadales bacterium]|nr:ADOP family duplicated permease [Gemmatimonadales bacterium]
MTFRWETLAQDLRYAVRGLRSKPAFTAAVTLTLALGIGANTAMFSVVDRLLFRPPALLRDPSRTHRIYLAGTYRGHTGYQGTIQFARYLDFTRLTHSFDRLAEVAARPLAIGVGTDAREMQVAAVSASFFGFFDAPPALGRYFTSAEDTTPRGAPVAVLGYGLWETRFGGRSDVLGQTIQIGATLYTIIGVAPRDFVGLWGAEPPAAYVPVTTYGAEDGANLHFKGEEWWTTYHWTWANLIAERKPGVSLDEATADLTQAYLKSQDIQWEREPGPHQPRTLSKPHGVLASILSERGPDESAEAKVATWLGGVALIVLLIACANVANLLLARALQRKREIAIRLALGVSRTRLAGQLLSESLLLALMGGLGGLLIAQFGGAVLRSALLSGTADAAVISDPRTLMIVGAATLLAGLLTGLAPVFQTRRADLTADLKAGVREGAIHRSRTRVALLVLQGALSVVLLVGAGLFVRSLRQIRHLPLGFDPDSVSVVSIEWRGLNPDSVTSAAVRRRLFAEAKTIPGVTHVSRQVTMPFWDSWNDVIHVPGIDSTERLGQFFLDAVSPDYFATMGTRLLRGRGIGDQDVPGAPRVMVVSRAMANVLWPGRDPLGQCVRVGDDTMPCTSVVGVAQNIKSQDLDQDPGFFYYVSSDQFAPTMGGLFVRTAMSSAAAHEVIRRRLQALMPGPSYVTVTPLSDIFGSETKSWRLGATMFTVFGLLALTLAAIGLYSVIAYNVAQRTHEMGVRMALGAEGRDVVRLVLREGLLLASIGVTFGGMAAFLAAPSLNSLLFQESPRDPVVLIGVGVTLLAVAALASLVPARRASRVDPMQALRSE